MLTRSLAIRRRVSHVSVILLPRRRRGIAVVGVSTVLAGGVVGGRHIPTLVLHFRLVETPVLSPGLLGVSITVNWKLLLLLLVEFLLLLLLQLAQLPHLLLLRLLLEQLEVLLLLLSLFCQVPQLLVLGRELGPRLAVAC